MIRFRPVLASALLAGAALAACAGGRTTPPQVPGTSAAPAPASAVLQIVIPDPGGAPQNGSRSVRYVSANAATATIVASGQNGPFTTTASIAAGAAGCTTSGNARTCAIAVNTPVGAVSLDVTISDASSTVLGHGTLNTTIGTSAPVVVTSPLVIGPVPGSYSYIHNNLPFAVSTNAPILVTVNDASAGAYSIPATSIAPVQNASPWNAVTISFGQLATTALSGITFASSPSACPGSSSITFALLSDTPVICSTGPVALGFILKATPSWTNLASSNEGVHFLGISRNAVAGFSMAYPTPGAVQAVSQLSTSNAFGGAANNGANTTIFSGVTSASVAPFCSLSAPVLLNNANYHPSVAVQTNPKVYVGGWDSTNMGRLGYYTAAACVEQSGMPAFPVTGVAVDTGGTTVMFTTADTVGLTGGGTYVTTASLGGTPTAVTGGAMTYPCSIVYSPNDASFIAGGCNATGSSGVVERYSTAGVKLGSITLASWPANSDVALTVSRYTGNVYAYSLGATSGASIYSVDQAAVFAGSLLYTFAGSARTMPKVAGYGSAQYLAAGADGSLYVTTYNVDQTSPAIGRLYNLNTAPILEANVANVTSSAVPWLLAFPSTNQLQWYDGTGAQYVWPSGTAPFLTGVYRAN